MTARTPTLAGRRIAGAVMPLFSVRASSEWGVGELTSMRTFGEVLARAKIELWMLLPLLEPTPGQQSPYSPTSSFALDPMYVGLDAVEEMKELGGRGALLSADTDALEQARGSFSVRHDIVRPLKAKWLAKCFEHFVSAASTARRARFESFRKEHAWWLHDYALFRALRDAHGKPWRGWPEPIRSFAPEQVQAARDEHEKTVLRIEYEQWLAFEQLADARQGLRALGIFLGGDEPFLVAEDSADVWANQARYRFDATVGAPPDAFSETGQDWGLPPYRWDAIAAQDYALFRERGAHAARRVDVARIDHVVGLYRTYHRPLDAEGHWQCYFVPSVEPEQRAQGEAVLNAFRESGLELIAEDLGVIPSFVRASLEELAIPGYRVLRWEEREGKIRPPREWPEISVATNGTHDTEPTASWFERLDAQPRSLVVEALARPLGEHYDAATHRAFLEAIFSSPSRYAILPVQDLFGLRGRINVPNTVGAHNWSWRMPWSTAAFATEPHLAHAIASLAELSVRAKRAS